jgi:hypothetical protein
MRHVLISGLAAGVLLLSTGCSSPSAPTPASAGTADVKPAEATAEKPADKKIGKTITVKDDESSADITLVTVGTIKEGTTPGIKAKSGSFVVFDLKIVGKKGEFSVNSLYVWMKTAAGKTVKGTDGMAPATTADPDLPLKDLGPGDEASGKVLLDAPLEPGGKMIWTDALDKPLAEWDL